MGAKRQERLQLQRVDQRRVLGDLVVEALGAVRAVPQLRRHDDGPRLADLHVKHGLVEAGDLRADAERELLRARRKGLLGAVDLRDKKFAPIEETRFDAATSVERRLAVDAHAQDVIEQRLLASFGCVAGALDLDAEPQARLGGALAYRRDCGLGGR